MRMMLMLMLMMRPSVSLTPVQSQPEAEGDCTWPRPSVWHHLPHLKGLQREGRSLGGCDGSQAAVETFRRRRRGGGWKLMRQFTRADKVFALCISLVCSDCFYSILQNADYAVQVKFKCSLKEAPKEEHNDDKRSMFIWERACTREQTLGLRARGGVYKGPEVRLGYIEWGHLLMLYVSRKF